MSVITTDGPYQPTVRWPSGLTQSFDRCRSTIASRSKKVSADSSRTLWRFPYYIRRRAAMPNSTGIPRAIETWLIDPLPAPDFALFDSNGNSVSISSFRGNPCF